MLSTCNILVLTGSYKTVTHKPFYYTLFQSCSLVSARLISEVTGTILTDFKIFNCLYCFTRIPHHCQLLLGHPVDPNR